VVVGASAAVSVPVTLRALGGDEAARAVVPFMVLFPGAVWMGASADGLFTGVTCAGLALLAVAAGRRGPGAVALAVAAGAVLGAACFLSYGLVLMAPLAVAVGLAARRAGPLGSATIGAVAVLAGFAAAGFCWWTGYDLVVERYRQGIAALRPYGYWVWANVACLVAAAGPAAAAGLRRTGAAVRPALRPDRPGWMVLPVAAAAAVLLADASGLSKAETERIWLPFAVWLTAAAAALPASAHRGWLAAQAGCALLINHLLLTTW
jgi:hypothetical protein